MLCSFSVTYCLKHCGLCVASSSSSSFLFQFALLCFFTFCLFICVDYKRLAPQ